MAIKSPSFYRDKKFPLLYGLRIYRNVTDINLVLYQSDFLNDNNGFRMRAILNPRNKNKAGGIEVGQEVYIIPTLPETTAEALRKHYNQI